MQKSVLEESEIDQVISCDIDKINLLLTDLGSKNEMVRQNAASIMAEMVFRGKVSGHEAKIVETMGRVLSQGEKNELTRLHAVNILGNLGQKSEPAIPYLFDCARKDESPTIRENSIFALSQIKSQRDNSLNLFVESLNDKDDEVKSRAIQALGNWNSDLSLKDKRNVVIKLISLLEKSNSKIIKEDAALVLIDYSASISRNSKNLTELDLAIKTISEVKHIFNLQQFDEFETSISSDLDNLQKIRAYTHWQSEQASLLLKFGGTIAVHLAVWLTLVSLYPRSPKIQAIFFWTPWIRRIVGAGYVGPVLVMVPFLRKKLLEPFRESLLADADLSNFNVQGYFKDLRVVSSGKEELELLRVAIPQLKGQIVLEGGSGLGKTMFLRYLCKESKQTVVYLLARRCQDGVIEAIQKKLHGEEIKDANFLRHLIYSGAVAICIDGLNEVNADTRAKIVEFAENYFKGDIILSTQPMDWRSPTTAQKYVIQPLDRDQIQAFLLSRAATLPHNAKLTGKDYEKACIQYLTEMLGQPKPELEAMQRILSNPMDLSTIALMLAAGEWPQPFGLQKQLYSLMAKVYEEQHLCPFPLEAFSEVVYQMRLDDKAGMVEEDFRDEISCLAQHRMMVPREVMNGTGEAKQKWYFRHDKIAEFFILQALIAHPDRQKQHLSDPRFRGVYFMLASFLDLEDAKCLRELLIQHAADTKDHTVSDEVIQLLREREGAIAGHA